MAKTPFDLKHAETIYDNLIIATRSAGVRV